MSVFHCSGLRVPAFVLVLFGVIGLASCSQTKSRGETMTISQAATVCALRQGHGLICGAGGDPNMLYGQWNGALTPLIYCANGCQVLPPRNGVRQDECRGLSDRPTVLIQAGHENISTNCRDTLSGSQALGATNEAQWTADIAERVVNRLARDDYNAFHVDGNFNCSPLAARHYDAAVSIHYRGLHDQIAPLNRGYFVGAIDPSFDEASGESRRLVETLNQVYGAVGIVSPAPLGTPMGNVPQYYLKNNDLLNFPDKCGFVLSRTTPFALIEAGVGVPNGADHDAMWSRQAEIADAIALGIEHFLVNGRQRLPRSVLERPPHAGPPRVMLVGDSITHGRTGDFTWRYRLHEHLRSSGLPFDFVGPFRAPWDPNFPDPRRQGTYAAAAGQNWDDDHDATWGRLLYHELDVIENFVRLHQPDLMVVDLGTNDLNPVFGGGSPVGVADNMRRLIRNARQGNPNLDFILVQIAQTGPIEKSGPAVARYIPEYAANLEWVARTDDRPMSHIQVANVFGNFNWRTDNWDETHPNVRGEHLIAKQVAAVLRSDWKYGGVYSAAIPLAGPPPPQNVQVNPTAIARNAPFTVTWDRVVNPGIWTVYKVQVRYHQNFGYGLVWESPATTGLSVTYDGPPLPQAGIFHIVVVSMDGTSETPSEPKPLEVNDGGPPAPTGVKLDPPAIAPNQPFTVTWPRVVNPGIWTTYKVQVRYHKSFGFGVVWESAWTTGLSVTYDGPALPQAGIFHVVVLSDDGARQSMSLPEPLEVNNPPRPADVRVMPSTIGFDHAFTVTWPRVVNPGVWTTYKVQVRYHQAYGFGLIWESAETPDLSLTYTGPTLPYTGTYAVVVVATDGIRQSMSAPAPLTLVNVGPPKPTHVVVDPPSIAANQRFTVTWPRVENPGVWTDYTVQVRYHQNYGFGMIWQSPRTTDLSVTYDGPPLPQPGIYAVVVVARDGTNKSLSEPMPLRVHAP